MCIRALTARDAAPILDLAPAQARLIGTRSAPHDTRGYKLPESRILDRAGGAVTSARASARP